MGADRGSPPCFAPGLGRLHHRRKFARINSPFKGWKFTAECIEPGRLADHVTVSNLLNPAGPASVPIGHDPSAFSRRLVKVEQIPSARPLRVLEHAAESSDCSQGRCETPAIVAKLLAHPGPGNDQRRTHPHISPPLAGRMRDDRVRSAVMAGVARFVPWIDPIQAVIGTVGFDVESSDWSFVGHRGFTVLRKDTAGGQAGWKDLGFLMCRPRPAPWRWRRQCPDRYPIDAASASRSA